VPIEQFWGRAVRESVFDSKSQGRFLFLEADRVSGVRGAVCCLPDAIPERIAERPAFHWGMRIGLWKNGPSRLPTL
jgi:hypothetical protein